MHLKATTSILLIGLSCCIIYAAETTPGGTETTTGGAEPTPSTTPVPSITGSTGASTEGGELETTQADASTAKPTTDPNSANAVLKMKGWSEETFNTTRQDMFKVAIAKATNNYCNGKGKDICSPPQPTEAPQTTVGETTVAATTAGKSTTKGTDESTESLTTASTSTATTKPSTAATKTSTATTKPSTAATKPSTATTKPSTATTKPSTATTSPSTATTKPSTATTKPSTATTSPSTATTKPSTATTSPSTAATSPSTATTKTSTATTKPSTATTKPSTATTKPSTATTKPSTAATTSTAATAPPGNANLGADQDIYSNEVERYYFRRMLSYDDDIVNYATINVSASNVTIDEFNNYYTNEYLIRLYATDQPLGLKVYFTVQNETGGSLLPRREMDELLKDQKDTIQNITGVEVEVESLPPVTPSTSPTTTTLPPTTAPGGGLSGGAIAGIVIGSLAGVALIAALIFYLCIRKKKNKDASGIQGSRHWTEDNTYQSIPSSTAQVAYDNKAFSKNEDNVDNEMRQKGNRTSQMVEKPASDRDVFTAL